VYGVLDDLELYHAAAGLITGLLLLEMGLTFGQQVGTSGQIQTLFRAPTLTNP
jgi:hypothetical protein